MNGRNGGGFRRWCVMVDDNHGGVTRDFRARAGPPQPAALRKLSLLQVSWGPGPPGKTTSKIARPKATWRVSGHTQFRPSQCRIGQTSET